MSWTILWVCAALAAAPILLNVLIRFVWAPIKLHGSQTLAANPPGEAIDPKSLTAEMREFFGFVVGRLRTAGFEELSLIGKAGAVPGVNVAQLLLVNRAAGDLAVVIATHSGLLRALVYAIRTDFADDTRVSTGVNPGVGTFPRDPRDVSQTFSFVEDPLLLYDAHRRQIERHGFGAKPRRPAPRDVDDAARYNEWDWTRNLRSPISRGYYWLDEPCGVYRMTWKGAFLMTWKIVPPVKQWRIALRDRRARRLWNELGMSEVAATAAPAHPAPVAAPAQMMPIATGAALATDAHAIPALPPPALGYQVGLAEGEVRIEREPGHVTVHAGGPTPARALARQKGRLLSIALFGGILAIYLIQWWQWRQLLATLPGAFAAPRRPGYVFGLPPFFWIWTALIAWEGLRLGSALRRARGMAAVVASPAGLRFANAAGRLADGEIPRGRIEALKVAPRLDGWKRTHDLKVRLHGSTREQLLFSSRDAASVKAARDALAEAMGIDHAAIDPTTGTPFTTAPAPNEEEAPCPTR